MHPIARRDTAMDAASVRCVGGPVRPHWPLGAAEASSRRRPAGRPPHGAPRMSIARRIRSALTGLAFATSVGVSASPLIEAWLATTLPFVPPLSVQYAFIDSRPVQASISVPPWQLPWTTTVDALRRDVTVWRMMHLADWNRVPDDLREAGLDAMLARYRRILVSPAAWDRDRATGVAVDATTENARPGRSGRA
jgi:hypothetical protein